MDEQPDYCVVPKKSSWFAKLKTNSRYFLSDIPGMPVFGLEQVSLQKAYERCVLLGTFYRPAVFSCYPNEVYGRPKFVRHTFMQNFYNLVWVTYRCRFRRLEGVQGRSYTSDAGWGCTIRVGQMILLNALVKHYGTEHEIDLLELVQENKLSAPFSLHKFCRVAMDFGRNPGDHFAPSTVAHTLESLLRKNPMENFTCKVFMDSVIVKEVVLNAATGYSVETLRQTCFCSETIQSPCQKCQREKPGPEVWTQSVLVMLPIMLGMQKLLPQYYPTIKCFLEMPQSIGMIGGKPGSALYIVGYQNNSLIILDPHLVQKACKSEADLIKKSHTYHCDKPKLLPLEEAESSLVIGFLFQGLEEFLDFERRLSSSADRIQGVIVMHQEEMVPPEDDDIIVLSD